MVGIVRPRRWRLRASVGLACPGPCPHALPGASPARLALALGRGSAHRRVCRPASAARASRRDGFRGAAGAAFRSAGLRAVRRPSSRRILGSARCPQARLQVRDAGADPEGGLAMDDRRAAAPHGGSGASDLHLKVGNVPFVRVDGELTPTTFDVLTADDTEAFANAVMTEHKRREFAGDERGRRRLHAHRRRPVPDQRLPPARARRARRSAACASEIPTFEELRLPAVMRELADSPRGLVLVTGPTGTGKTTTIASMIGHINRTRRAHIVTIEDPIEVVHDDELSIIQQREIGIDTDSYAAALKSRHPPGPRRDLRRARSATPSRRCRRSRRPRPATSSSRPCTRSTAWRRSTACSTCSRRTSRRRCGPRSPGALRGIVSQRLVPRPTARAACPRSRCSINTGPRLRPDRRPRADRRDRRRDRRRRVLRDADLRPGAREAREGGPGDGRRRAAHGDEPARLRPRARAASWTAAPRIGGPAGRPRAALRHVELAGALGARAPSGAGGSRSRIASSRYTGMNSGPHAQYCRT